LRLLLDENLSPYVALCLRKEGHDAIHLRKRGGLGLTDPQVFQLAFDEDRILVTANVIDFKKLARAHQLHAGVVFLEEGALLREEQLEVLKRVVIILAQENMANRALTISLDGEFLMEDLSAF
jgi:predicted nuclease of predicted toxin-antitoxin system